MVEVNLHAIHLFSQSIHFSSKPNNVLPHLANFFQELVPVSE